MTATVGKDYSKAILSPHELFSFLCTFMKMKRPIIVHSSPGLGKSQIGKQAARATFGAESVFADCRGSQFDATILRGFPDMPPRKGSEKRYAEFAPLALWPRKGPGVIMLDELDKADQEVQNALLELLLDRRLGDYTVPDDVMIIGACNKMIDRAGSQRLTTALKSRCVHLELTPSLEDWLAWATGADVHPLVMGYLELKGAPALYSFDPADTEAMSFPCPRTWEMLSDGLKLSHDDKFLYHLIAGCIGANPTAGDFCAFAKWFYKLPSKAEVLGNAATFKIPDE